LSNCESEDFLATVFLGCAKGRSKFVRFEIGLEVDGVCLVASKEARCVGAGGNGINLGLNRKVEIVVAKKKPP